MASSNGHGMHTPPNPFETLDLPAAPSFASLLERLYQQRYSGSVTFHFENGIPRGVVLTQVQQVALARGAKG
jgi:hypothetical protein